MREAFALMCGYAIGNFYKDVGYDAVCHHHTHIVSEDGSADTAAGQVTQSRIQLAIKSPTSGRVIALGLDLLAHSEAYHRAANRLEAATRVLTRDAGSRGTPDPGQVQQLRGHITALEELSTTNRTLLSEFSRELKALLGG